MECKWNLSFTSERAPRSPRRFLSLLRRTVGASLLAVALSLVILPWTYAADFDVSIEQLTSGKYHHFFGYIGQSKTIPWNASGRYILSLQTSFHDRMPEPGEAADVVLVDTTQNNRVIPIEKSRAWNFQQGTMFYWNPKKPETQFFFNDRDPQTGRVFAVLYDIKKHKRIREYRYKDVTFGNSGVAQHGGFFLGINYGRLARLRPVTGYPGAADWTQGVKAPTDDGIFKVNVKTGEKQVLVSFKQLADLIRPKYSDVDKISLFINHTLWNRDDSLIYFYVRGNWGNSDKSLSKIDVPCTIHPDGTGLTMLKSFIGGHPEWATGHQLIGSKGGRQVIYDVDKQKVVGYIGTKKSLPKTGGDISFSPDGNWFVNGDKDGNKNYYVIFRMSDGAYIRTPGIYKGPYKDDLRVDPAPRWNRTSDAILVPGVVKDDIRQLFMIKIHAKNK